MSDPSLSFGAVAAAYDRGRPDYPRDAVQWLVGSGPKSVLELGAGTGKLTRALVGMGHDVFATDPDDGMLDVLSGHLPDVRATVGTAEQIPAPDSSADVVIVAQAFHWFDLEKALPEIIRVLRPGGELAIVWNRSDTRIPWVKKLEAALGVPPSVSLEAPSIEALDNSGLFGAIDHATFKHWNVINSETLLDLANSVSTISTLSEHERAAKIAAVVALYDDYGRGMDGMQVPIITRCYRTKALPKSLIEGSPAMRGASVGDTSEPTVQRSLTDTASSMPAIATGDDTGLILFNFD